MFSPMVDRERIIAAQDAWRDAETAYSDEAAKFVAVWWVEAGPPPTVPEPVTREALNKLNRLRKVADDMRDGVLRRSRRGLTPGSPGAGLQINAPTDLLFSS